MEIRKISVGPDYKDGAMHYIVGQDVLRKEYVISTIRINSSNGNMEVWISKNEETFLWKSFTDTMPISVEYNINFE